MYKGTKHISDLIIKAVEKARRETSSEPEPEATRKIRWPVHCTVGPGLEGAIACETKVGYVNGTKGWLIYRGYDIFDLCANSSFEEVAYLLLRGRLPTQRKLESFKKKLERYRSINPTIRHLMSFPVQEMNSMAALRLGMLLLRQKRTYRDKEAAKPDITDAIYADEDSIPMETKPMGEARAIYEFKTKVTKPKEIDKKLLASEDLDSCCALIAAAPTVAAAVSRIRRGLLPIEPDPELNHAANFIYMMTGRHPTAEEERIMDVALILHADHGINASTFAAMVVASTLSDIYFSIGAGIAALTGPLHGGANEEVLHVPREIGSPANVKAWLVHARARKRKIMGFGHRVYKAYDPRARVLAPLAKYLAHSNKEILPLYRTARALEKEVIGTIGKQKGIFPNVDFYSGLVYMALGIPTKMFTPIFAVSRVAGWTARVLEYLQNNRIFRPRAMYIGQFEKKYVPIGRRMPKSKSPRRPKPAT